MYREKIAYLQEWRHRTDRKPLIVRGARQVGKSWLVREFGKEFRNFVEINFDETPESESLFQTNDIGEVIQLIEAERGTNLVPGETLLFLDEIQNAPSVLPTLRYFYEKIPELHVIAAGSLLDFLLSESQFSMPVGRIEFMFLAPLSYEEYLMASSEDRLLDYIKSFTLKRSIPESIHRKCQTYLRNYFIVGGMPEAVDLWIQQKDLNQIQRCHSNIRQTYEADFSKYSKKANPEHLRTVFRKLPRLIGNKIRYVNIDRYEKPADLSKAIKQLSSAGIITLVYHSDGNGIPLNAQRNDRKFKAIFLDTGLYSAALSLRLSDLSDLENALLINSGALAEQFVGQQLLNLPMPWEEPEMHYWHREKRGSSAEVDYLISMGTEIIPVEVKAGKTGSLRSLHVFACGKSSKLGLRFNNDVPSATEVRVNLPGFTEHKYTLISLPLYLAGQADRLVDAMRQSGR